jgi:hypothetical protein
LGKPYYLSRKNVKMAFRRGISLYGGQPQTPVRTAFGIILGMCM